MTGDVIGIGMRELAVTQDMVRHPDVGAVTYDIADTRYSTSIAERALEILSRDAVKEIEIRAGGKEQLHCTFSRARGNVTRREASFSFAN